MAPSALSNFYRRLRSNLGGKRTGIAERQPDEPGSPWWGEHLARYQFAKKFVRPGIMTLDFACGTGFGLRLLCASGARVVGADIDAGATRRAAETVGSNNAVVLRGDARRMPFASRVFGLITSFETIEHLEDRTAFVAELRRVLASDGVCLISTPNALYSRPVDGKPRNPFHVHEYEPAELETELRHTFSRVQIVGQILDGRFRVPPFWDDQQRLPRTPATLAGLWTRRIVHRLPAATRDRASHLIWGHTFFPLAADYHFDLARVEDAQVLVAICGSA